MIGNKIAVVTGSSKGIGKAIALAFARSKEYSGIVINARRMNEALLVSNEIKNMGCDSIAVEADISKESDCVRIIVETIEHFGRIDVLVKQCRHSRRCAIY